MAKSSSSGFMFNRSSYLDNIMEINNVDILQFWCRVYFKFIFMQINKCLTFIN